MKTTHERLKIFLDEHQHMAKKSLGQNFLINDQVVEKMLNELKQTHADFVFEIGPGPGALTDHLLLDYAQKLLLIELDSAIAEIWKERGATLLSADALQIPWRDLISEKQTHHGKNLVLISNLPYQIASTLVIDRSFDEQPLTHMILMFQKEVAERMRAKEDTDDYGFLSVVAQSFWKIRLLVNLGRHDFSPPPKVNSQVLTFQRLPEPEFLKDLAAKKKFLHLIKAAFSQRRKVMRKNLGQLMPTEAIKEMYAALQLDENVRAEQISVALFHKMFTFFQNGKAAGLWES